ncbi:MAG: bifunctional YncE family protein/alkaline phosphatase family protein [Proteobacteria bacterium]|nr:bifunctional YncE family protein/alkaline phosphatase family protein [Pseudomonadota bacterium]
MPNKPTLGNLLGFAMAAAAVQMAPQAQAQSPDFSRALPVQIPSGQYITPTYVRGAVQQLLNPQLPAYPGFVAAEAVKSQLSPAGTTLAVICAGYNSLFAPNGTVDKAASTQFIFLYNVAGKNKMKPVLLQAIPQTNAHVGLVFSPDGKTLYAAGGKDDVVYAYTVANGTWSLAGTIDLGHGGKGIGVGVGPNASGLGVSADGKTLVVANNYNDSISVIDTATRTVRYEHDLRPFFTNNEGVDAGIGGTFPFGVVIKGNNVVYVSSDRDREVVAVDISSPSAGHLLKRIKLDGNGLGMTLDRSGSRLYVAQDNADEVAVVDTGSNKVIHKIDARAPAGLLSSRDEDRGHDSQGDGNDDGDRGHGRHGAHYTGAATFAVTLSPDGNSLYAVNSGANSIAVIPVNGRFANQVVGLIPTAYDPRDITFSADGSWMYIINGKSVTGPNTQHLSSNTGSMTSITYPGGNTQAAANAKAANQYQLQLERSSLVSAAVPNWLELPAYTAKVAQNNFYGARPSEDDAEVMKFLHKHIKHVIYVIKENRTYDQILGDLNNGANGDPSITQFGAAITPNFHNLATDFVTLDNFTDPGDGSMDGWSWALQGRVTNTETITQQINYGAVSRGLSYESEGTNRSVPVNYGTVAQRDAVDGPAGTTNYSAATANLPGGTANTLTGKGNHASSDAPFGVQNGYIFDAVLQAGGTVRNYGFLVNNIGSIGTKAAPVSDPFSQNVVQAAPLDPSLASLTDVYFRGYDQSYPDFWRYNEWKREFDQFVANKSLPNLSLVRLSHDHTGSFSTALGGVNTPETEQADDDMSVGLLVQAVAKSPYADDTVIIITEDDCQDGPDHVDSHRATSYVVGPYVKKKAIVSEHYSQVSVLRTIEDILGAPHINLNTAFQRPMAKVFDIRSSKNWDYTATASTVIKTTTLFGPADANPVVAYASGPDVKPKHDAAYWAKATVGFNFAEADQVPPAQYNKVLWKGLMGSKPYPTIRNGSNGKKTAMRDDD